MAHYLDDYITVGPPTSSGCQNNLDRMLALCRRLGIPVAPAKCEGPATVLVFLGFELDTENLVVRLPRPSYSVLWPWSANGLGRVAGSESWSPS